MVYCTDAAGNELYVARNIVLSKGWRVLIVYLFFQAGNLLSTVSAILLTLSKALSTLSIILPTLSATTFPGNQTRGCQVFYAYDDQSIIRNERGAGERYAELFQVYVDQCHLFR